MLAHQIIIREYEKESLSFYLEFIHYIADISSSDND